MAPSSIAGSEAGTPSRPRIDKDSKGAVPDYYYGDRYKLEDWFIQIEMYFIFNRTTEGEKTMIAVSFMRGRAQGWMKPFLQQVFNSPNPQQRADPRGMFSNFNNFKTELRTVFGISNDKNAAIRTIQYLTQKSSASEYAIKFTEYA